MVANSCQEGGRVLSFFVQVDPGGATFRTFYRFLAAYVDNGVYSITPDDWHFLVSTYDGAKFKTYLNGVLSGSQNQTSSVTVDNGLLGIGAAPDGSNAFNGWIDDVRLYKTALSAENVDTAYNDGFGDFGPTLDFNVSRASNVLPIPVSITFKDRQDNPVGVTGFDLGDLTIHGATASNLVVDSNSTYSFDLTATRDPQRIYLTVNAGAVQDALLDYNQKKTVVVTYNDKVTRSADLVGWWAFDEFNGTDLVADQSGGDAFASLQGGALLETVSPKFGTGSLLLDGVDDWAEVSSLMPPTKITRFDDLEGWWPLDGNASDMSGNFRDGTIGGQSEWTGGRMGQAFKLTGNDHIVINGYKGISGTKARTLSLWFKTQNASWRTLAYWGTDTRGQRWWLRLNGNDLRIDFWGSVRNTTEFKLNDGVWHNVVTVLPEGGNDRSSPVLYVDGKKTTVNGQWGGQNQLSTGNTTDFSIGKRWDNGQRFIGSIDDVRLYSVAFSDFEVEMLYGESKGSPLDVGEGNYTISVWAKPTTLSPPVDYDFATAWYEGGGGDWMQVRMGQGMVTLGNYNSLSILDPGDPQQSSLFPQGVTERIFDGSFGNGQLDPIDSGSGFLTRSDHVYEDTAFDLPINFNAGAVDARSGGLTGADSVGGVWFGKLRIGNSGFIKSGTATFGTRSDDGSVFWLDLDRNGVFSKNGAKGSELIVDNKGNHGQRNRVGTASVGFNAPLLLRSGLSAHKGVISGIEGYTSVYHATVSEGLTEISNLPMVQNQWHHLASVVDKDAGTLRHYLNGALVAESFFSSGESGEVTLGDWFLGGMPALDRFHGLLDDARVYSVALTDAEIAKIYNGGEGDMGLVGVFTAPSISNLTSIPVTLQFQRYEEAVAVTGLDASDLSAGVSGATITGFSSCRRDYFHFQSCSRCQRHLCFP